MLRPDEQRLEHILDYCNRIEKTVARYGRSYELFLSDMDYQQSIAFSIFQIGELSGHLSPEFREATSSEIPWVVIKAMRNIVVHSYNHVNLDTLWDTALHDIPSLKAFCEDRLNLSHTPTVLDTICKDATARASELNADKTALAQDAPEPQR